MPLISSGEFGNVREVLTDGGIKFAAKIIKLPVQLVEQQNAENQFKVCLDIGRNLCHLLHTNIVRFLYLSPPLNSSIVLFMELLAGKSLESVVEKNKLNEDIICYWTRQICSALQYMHSRKSPVIHTDIRCSNIFLLESSNKVKLIDFGVTASFQAVYWSDSISNTRGKFNFLAPELLESEDLVNVRYSRESDIWALGCTVYQMATGTVPYPDCNNIQTVLSQIKEHGAPTLPDQCSSSVNNFYQSCVALGPGNRKSATDLLEHEFLVSKLYESPPFLEKWDIVCFLGRGAFGEVNEVLTDFGIRCAAKKIHPPMNLGDQLDKKFKAIIDAEKNLCQLIHQNIVRYMYLWLDSKVFVVFMEYLDGNRLENVIDGKALDVGKISNFSYQICSALQYLHSRETPVIHRDINCNNIMVLNGGYQIKLIDFGLSLELQLTHHSTNTMTPKGTLNFMAPELLGSDDSASVRYSKESDIWAFGCTVFQMATGNRPHSDCRDLLSMALTLEKRGAPALPESCSEELRDFYSCCVARDSKRRKCAADLLRHKFLPGPRDVDFIGKMRDREKAYLDELNTYSFGDMWVKGILLGRGVFGEVRKLNSDPNRYYAAKIIRVPVQIGSKQHLDAVRQAISKCVRSEMILCKLRHDNIVQFLHLKHMEDFTVVLFMELLNGESLEQWLKNEPVDKTSIRKFAVQICSALHYLHSHEPPVIHRDINCSNVIVIDRNHVKLINFGLSIKLGSIGSSTVPRGNANFMAPELFGSEDSEKMLHSRESDIWAFGCTVYQMATGNVPFSGCDMVAIFLRLQQHGAPQVPDQCSALLRNFYQSCVAKEPSDRKSADELLKDEFLMLPTD